MALFNLFRRAPRTDAVRAFPTRWTDEGVEVCFANPLVDVSVLGVLELVDAAEGEDALLGAYLAQLAMDDGCEVRPDSVLISWSGIYTLLREPDHQGAVQLLGLPAQRPLRPLLTHEGQFSDEDFGLHVYRWAENQGLANVTRVSGAVASVDGIDVLLPEAAWATWDAIKKFADRPSEQRSQHANELAWGHIRAFADLANALYEHPYLETTYILTPDSLRLQMKQEETQYGRVVTIAPTFDGAPDGWLRAFDGFNSVQGDYKLTDGGTKHIRVVLSDPVRRVLEVVKRMPGRRVAGAAAEKFIHNPWAFLGDDAHSVLNEEDFLADKAGAGAVSADFRLVPRISLGRIDRVDLVVTESFADGMASSDTRPLAGIEGLGNFTLALGKAITDDSLRFPWDEYDLTITADSQGQYDYALQTYELWKNQPAAGISFEDIYEMDGYSARIEGIGIAKPIYVPVLKAPEKTSDASSGLLPEDLTPAVMVSLHGAEGPVMVELSQGWVTEFEQQVADAEKNGTASVKNAALPTAVATPEARALADGFKSMMEAQDKIRGDGNSTPRAKGEAMKTLLVKTNFHQTDYEEQRRDFLTMPEGTEPKLPNCLRNSIKLKKHQTHGIAWLQHLVAHAPDYCRGALLADDMGLGKSLQLLTVLARYYEENPNAPVSVIFAPKSLLENWLNETTKFFTPSFPVPLVLYGAALQALKQPLNLVADNVKKEIGGALLKPNWAGDSKIIITTYDVLTNYEFSFAKVPFAFMICDEAQRLKTPGTKVTLAAKKLKAEFRIACTGTPVENSLVDLWCLFDFVQPGLLGALEEFGKTYRRPIECNTDELKATLERLQALISPQTLRRTKASIASELPKKLFGFKCRTDSTVGFKSKLEEADRLDIEMSQHQLFLYRGGLKKLRDANGESNGRKRAKLSFGALHLMKAVCAEPYCLPGTKFLRDSRGLTAHLVNSPKLRWMLEHLRSIQTAGEKAIIFTELRETQLALFYFLKETFKLKPFIINGDSQGRQSYIDKFSATQGFDVIILSTLAAGAGLNVTAANHVFHFTRAWNPAKENQATDRAYRIGQEKDVYVYCPTVVTDDFHTFEARLDDIMKRKAGLADATIDGDGMTSMLNGAGAEPSFADLVGSGEEGVDIPERMLTLDDIDRMDGDSFELFCQILWSKQGFQAAVTEKAGGDGGVDVIALKGRHGELLQCKSSINDGVGWDAIKEVNTGAARYQLQFAGTRFKKVAVTNQNFNANAASHAQACQVHLIQRGDLEALLQILPISNRTFDNAVCAAIA